MSSLDLVEVERKLYAAVTDLLLVPKANVSRPNKQASTETLPRIDIDRPYVHRPLTDLKGRYTKEVGTLAVTFVVEKETGSKAATTLATRLMEALPVGQQIDLVPNGRIVFTGFPQEDQGYADYGTWRLPVMLSYVASA